MKFGIFYEHQLPRPWESGAELRPPAESHQQPVLAAVGFDGALPA
jgi:hypothetical protein